MAKALTAEARDKKVAAQEKVVARLVDRRARAEKTLREIDSPLAFEEARLVHLRNTPILDDEAAAALAAATAARKAKAETRAAAIAAGEPDPGPGEGETEGDESADDGGEAETEQDELTFA